MLAAAAVIAITSGDDGGQTPGQAKVATEATGPAAATAPAGATEEAARPVPVLVSGSVTELEYEKGDKVVFKAESETGDEIHVHGYDIEQALPPGETVEVSFTANLDGVFEIELHDAGEQIGELTVNP